MTRTFRFAASATTRVAPGGMAAVSAIITTNTMQTVTTNGPGIVWGVQTNISYSRPPHHSPQYNMLIGIVQPDYLTTDASGVATNFIARHSIGVSSSSGIYNTNQCATCHVPQYAVNAGTNVTGHTFNLDTNGCALGGCHSGGCRMGGDAGHYLQPTHRSGCPVELVGNRERDQHLRRRQCREVRGEWLGIHLARATGHHQSRRPFERGPVEASDHDQTGAVQPLHGQAGRQQWRS